MIQIIDNTLTTEEEDLVLKLLLRDNFPWYVPANGLATTTYTEKVDTRDKNIFEDNHFVHNFMWDGQWTDENENNRQIVSFIFSKLLNKLNLEAAQLFRVKANIQNKTHKKGKYNTPHVDGFGEHKVAIYYVCDSDGDTHIFENDIYPWKLKEKVTPKKGRFLVFDGKHYHAGCHPKNNNYRIVINYNFL